jgi:hypothetical protein
VARECDRKEEVLIHLWGRVCKLGFEGICVLETFWGAGLEFFQYCLIT